MESFATAVVLSRGGMWSPEPHEAPFLLAAPGQAWPTATAQAIFYDSAGAILATVDGTVTPAAVSFTAQPGIVDPIPQGAGFEIILTTTDGPVPIRYGKVIRKEAQFIEAPTISYSYQALQFSDTFPTLGLRSSWIPIAGTVGVYDNSFLLLPNGVTAVPGLLGAQAAIRWFTPLNSDSPRVNVNLVAATDGKTTVILAADQRFTSYLGVQFEHNTGTGVHAIHFCKGTGPNTVTYEGSPVSNVVANSVDNYTIAYSAANDTAYVYHGGGGDPIASWQDTAHVIPHGPGYRYLGLAWDNGILAAGIEATYWSAKDDV